MDNAEWATTIREQLERENAVGGDLVDFPCPFCKLPRSQRSDYIRCNPCGINWLNEERHLPNYLNRNPAAARSDARTVAVASKSAGTSRAGAEQ